MRRTRRTTIDFDVETLVAALEAAPGKTQTAVINEALRAFARRRRLRDLLKFGRTGRTPRWEGDLDAFRSRRP